MITSIVSCRVGSNLLVRTTLRFGIAVLLLISALPAASQVLFVDDGTPEERISAPGRDDVVTWMNVLSPPEELCGDYQIEAVQVMWEDDLAVGDSARAYVYEDTDGDRSPVTGALLLAEVPGVRVQFNDEVRFSEYALAAPVTVTECRDVIVVFVGTGMRERQVRFVEPALLDSDNPQGRSWITRPSETPPLPPILSTETLLRLPDALPGRLDGNFMIRAVASAVVTSGGEAQRVRFELGAPSPSSARGITRVAFTLSQAGTVRAQVRTLDGRVVRSAEQSHGAGEGVLSLDVSGLAAGVYLLVTQTPDGTSSRQVVVAR